MVRLYTDDAASLSSLARIEAADGGPDERLGVGVVLGEVAVDGGLQVDERVEDAAPEAPPGELGRRSSSTALSQEPEVGVKWKVQRGCRSSQARPWDACGWHSCRG